MKSIELTAYAVREYDVKYTVILDENDPIIQKYLNDNEMTFDELYRLGFQESRELWDTLMSVPNDDIKFEEDFAPAEERFVDFDNFITEN